MLRAGEWKAMAEGTQEKFQTHSRDKASLLGRGEEERKENPFVNFGTNAPPTLRHGSADCPWSICCSGYGFLRGRPGFLFGRASRAAFFGSTAGLKSGYFAM